MQYYYQAVQWHNNIFITFGWSAPKLNCHKEEVVASEPLELGTVLSNCKVFTLVLPNKKFGPILIVLGSFDLNARVSLANLAKLELLKLSELLKVNEARLGTSAPN